MLYGVISQLLSEVARDWSRCPRAACRRRRRCCGARCDNGRFLRRPEIRAAMRRPRRGGFGRPEAGTGASRYNNNPDLSGTA
jgi:hypothetical protein